MSSEELDIWGMPIRPSAPAPEEGEIAEGREDAPSDDAPAPEEVAAPVAEAEVEAAVEPAPVPPALAKPITVPPEEIAAALAAVNEIASRPSAPAVASVEESVTVEAAPAPVVEATVVPAVEAPSRAAESVETPVAEVATESAPKVEEVAPPVVVTTPVASTVESAAEAPVVETPAAEARVAESPVAATVVEEKPVVAAVAAAEVLADEPGSVSEPVDVWGDAPKVVAATVAAAAVVESAATPEATRTEVDPEAPRPVANPLRRKRASRSSNDPVQPTPAQYTTTPGSSSATTLSQSGVSAAPYAISSSASGVSASSPYALTPSAPGGASPVSTPVSTPIPPATTPVAATTPTASAAPAPDIWAAPLPSAPTVTPVGAPSSAPPLETPVTAAIPPGAMPVAVPVAAAVTPVTRVDTYAPPPMARPARQAAEAKIEVVNAEGWHRDFPLKSSILYVGSAPGADIVLPSSEIAPRHLQFVPSTANRIGYRLINLGATPVAVQAAGGGEARIAAARGSLELNEGDRVELGGYALVFHGGEITSNQIQARVEVPNPRLTLEKPLDGALYIRNGGEKAGVQFLVEVQGIDSRYIQVEPGPVLFPGMEKRVAFRMTHPHTATPAAGDQPINFVVTAPEGYPGETAIASQVITVAPFFAHKVRLIAIEPELSGYSLSSGR